MAPISLFGVAPQVLIVNPKLPVQTVPEFVAYVKSQKEKLAYAGGGGPGSASNLLMSLFLKRAGLEMTGVSYRGTAPALTDLIAGHIPAMFVPISEALPQARAGLIRMLAVSSGTRSSNSTKRISNFRSISVDLGNSASAAAAKRCAMPAGPAIVRGAGLESAAYCGNCWSRPASISDTRAAISLMRALRLSSLLLSR